MDAVTHGVCKSTTHRVLSPEAGLGPRFSIPFFGGVSYDAAFEAMDMPRHVLRLRDERIKERGRGVDDVEFTFTKGKWAHLGEATLSNRVKSHPDVGERWNPDILARIREEQAEVETAKAKKTQNVSSTDSSNQGATINIGSVGQAIKAN